MKFILYGAGQQGLEALKEFGRDNVLCFVDSNKEGSVGGIPVKKLHEVVYMENCLIVITSGKYGEEISDKLQSEGISNYIFYKKGMAGRNYRQRISAEKWSDIYNEELIDNVSYAICNEHFSVWTEEMLRITRERDAVLEIGCGSGETSLALAKHGRKVTALDYTRSSLQIVNAVSSKYNLGVDTVCCDATGELPFEERKFDLVFQAGLLEYFDKEERIRLLRNWKKYCRKMVSLIPNAHSLAYRLGKYIQEQNGTWIYGLEMPQASLREEFEKAGLKNIMEYSIGQEHSLTFLPQEHYLRAALEKFFKEWDLSCGADIGQGYLLVTIGENI